MACMLLIESLNQSLARASLSSHGPTGAVHHWYIQRPIVPLVQCMVPIVPWLVHPADNYMTSTSVIITVTLDLFFLFQRVMN